jgi:hypothetical protein
LTTDCSEKKNFISSTANEESKSVNRYADSNFKASNLDEMDTHSTSEMPFYMRRDTS